MSSFQQVVMGGICLVAAFWFGAYINEQPVDANLNSSGLQPMADGTLVSSEAPSSGTLAQKTKGFLSSLFETPAEAKPITLEQLKSQSQTPTELSGSPMSMPAMATNFHSADDSAVVADGANSFTAPNGSFRASANHDSRINEADRIAIVPDFSTLAEELKRDTRFPSVQPQSREAQQRLTTQETSARMLPVPNVDQYPTPEVAKSARDWNIVKQEVMSVEEKLKQFRQSQPVAEVFQPMPPLAPSPVKQSRVVRGTEPPRVVESLRAVEPSRTVESPRFDNQGIAKNNSKNNPAREFPTTAESTGRQSRWLPNPAAESLPVGYETSMRPRSIETTVLRAAPKPSRSESLRSSEPLRSKPMPPMPPKRVQASSAPSTVVGRQAFETLEERRDRWQIFGDGRQTQSIGENESGRKLQGESRENVNNISGRVRSLNQPIDERTPYEVTDRIAIAKRRPVKSNTDQWNSRSPSRVQSSRRLPAQTSAPEYADPPAPIVRYEQYDHYTTKANDTLQLISQNFYQTPEYYFDLYLANHEVLANPATVPVGVKLKIPRLDNR